MESYFLEPVIGTKRQMFSPFTDYRFSEVPFGAQGLDTRVMKYRSMIKWIANEDTKNGSGLSNKACNK